MEFFKKFRGYIEKTILSSIKNLYTIILLSKYTLYKNSNQIVARLSQRVWTSTPRGTVNQDLNL